ncbi:MAG TPA: sigma factor [Myxococcales bacterium]|nr:sigma factor [Myxococcales bacterium]
MADGDLDAELPAIQRGDAGAFGRWMAAAEPELRRALRPLAASVDAEAVLQEGLLRVWQVAPRLRPDGRGNSLLRLAVTITRNVALGELRRLRPELSGDEVIARAQLAADAGRAPPLPDPHLRQAISQCREKLPRKPAEALDARLHGGGGEPDETLAERLGMRLNTFLQNVTRARRLLLDCLKRRGVPVEEL